MALTYTNQGHLVQGNARVNVVDVLADGTYVASSGYTLAVADYQSILGGAVDASTTAADSRILTFVSVRNPGGVEASYDGTNKALRFYEAGAEATTTISSKTVRCIVTFDAANK